ncbi:IS66 family transposase [Limosilactobacillus sp. STM2_1]|uniref:IS66 family transposase n=1 Tax=Limosilactobacillus rudii TaxID=2759755 RepID=A0A7W3YLU9_9LACO|nr:IS66 family transposase [Limosilactobacillus rudii]MBB1080302.1 IS66 family transposase [Limosilactobacillus rudii]MBB1096794.1 IS66 family transposase [Limosilactobacillus rudii]MCD7133692.1 IS66 family transposase [Limosilactobacillus rudii]
MNKDLAEENRELKQQVKALREQVNKLTAIIKLQQNQMFGKKTEVIDKVVEGQQSLFSDQDLEQLQDNDVSITEVIEQTPRKVVRHRKPKASGQRTTFLNTLPQVNHVIHLESNLCPDCHQEMNLIGKHLYSREPKLKPAELLCVNYYQESYRCNKCCHQGGDKIFSSKMPQSLLPHSYFSGSILAKVAEYKFNLALPFHRQIKLWQALGLPVKGRQLATNIIKVSQTYLEPLYQHLLNLTKQEPVVHMDETPFKVIDERNETSYFWVTRTTKEFSKHQIAMFHYFNTRSGKIIGKLIGHDYGGIIMCDGYCGYSNRLYPRAKFGSCLVHIRREFYRITRLLKKDQLKHSKAYQVLKLMRPIFYYENRLKYHNQLEKLQQRRLLVKPLVDQLYCYLEAINFPQGKLKAAINNALKLKERVYRIFENGQVPLTNNPVEQTIRPSTLIRKNSLFAKSIGGAQASAVFYSLTATAKLNHLNLYKYFEYLFDHLPNRKNEGLEAYLPWAKQVQENCHE